ncbi:hypothetical protein [Neisseria shayeganii]|uniref:Secreted protein n=1 Tax=Neisseria shayeganii 871 TaxID=1032488 RepID=G4CIJ3_9NEIS|nr:hypothetical protein [Neisseria shayeganii]EGY52357.1 hypothetical protein HMPREF9371_1432 [Neisseria shayeganii 871]
MPSFRLCLYVALLTLGSHAFAAPLENLPAGLYRQGGNTTITYSGGEQPFPPVSPGEAGERTVCIPADSGAWYQQQLARFPQTITPQMQDAGVMRTALRARIDTDREGRPQVWFGYSEDSRGPQPGMLTHTHSNLFYTYLGQACSLVEAAAAAADVNAAQDDR